MGAEEGVRVGVAEWGGGGEGGATAVCRMGFCT